MIFQGATILLHIVVYHNKSKALAAWKVKQKQENKPQKKKIDQNDWCLQTCINWGKWCTSFWAKSLIQLQENKYMDGLLFGLNP
jgi:hypothetical protein